MTTVNYDYDQLFPGRFLKAGEFQGRDVTLTISNIELEEMEDRKGTKTKCIMSFKETKKQLVLNRTNGECLKGLWGRKVADWVGKRITFHPATVEAFGAPTLAIRVKGSPDLKSDLTITCKLGRQGDVKVPMKRTGGKPAPKSAAAPKPAPAPVADEPPPCDPTTGEVFGATEDPPSDAELEALM
jgi:hypothetical protein